MIDLYDLELYHFFQQRYLLQSVLEVLFFLILLFKNKIKKFQYNLINLFKILIIFYLVLNCKKTFLNYNN